MPNYSPIHTLSPSRVNTLPRTIGVELELAHWGSLKNNRLSFKNFTAQSVHDWSVKPSMQELVVAPMNGDQFIRAMLELAKQLTRNNVKVNDTCAYHVHIGGSDLSYWELRRLLRVYEKLEGQVYEHLVLPYRSSDPVVAHYCQKLTVPHRKCARCERYDMQFPNTRRGMISLGDIIYEMNHAKCSRDIKQAICRMLYNIPELSSPNTPDSKANLQRKAVQLQMRKGGKYEWCRYVGLNLHAWMYRGTVEWRMKEASTNLEELITWPLWCGWFVEAASRMTEAESLASSMNLLEFTQRWMPRWVADWVEQKIRTIAKLNMERWNWGAEEEVRIPQAAQGLQPRPMEYNHGAIIQQLQNVAAQFNQAYPWDIGMEQPPPPQPEPPEDLYDEEAP